MNRNIFEKWQNWKRCSTCRTVFQCANALHGQVGGLFVQPPPPPFPTVDYYRQYFQIMQISIIMRDSDYLWMPDNGYHKSIEIHTTQQMQPLGFDLRPRAEREREARNARRRAASRARKKPS